MRGGNVVDLTDEELSDLILDLPGLAQDERLDRALLELQRLRAERWEEKYKKLETERASCCDEMEGALRTIRSYLIDAQSKCLRADYLRLLSLIDKAIGYGQ